MVNDVGGCEALVFTLLSVSPEVPNAFDLILRAAVASASIADHAHLR